MSRDHSEAQPLLSIVVVNWNGREILSDCLDSIRRNDEQLNYEVIVVDNGSTDGSCELLMDRYQWVRLIRNEENRGFAAANNQGFEIAKGSLVLMLNSDTIVLGNVIQQSLDYMVRHVDIGIMGCRVLNRDGTLQPTCARQPGLLTSLLKTTGLHRLGGLFGYEHYAGWRRDRVRSVGIVTGCYLMTRTVVLEEVGGLDERFFFNYEETDFCRRVAQAGWQVIFAPVGHIIHLGGGSSGQDNPWREINLIRGKVQFFLKHAPVKSWPVWSLAVLFWLMRLVLLVCGRGKVGRFSYATAKAVLSDVIRIHPYALRQNASQNAASFKSN